MAGDIPNSASGGSSSFRKMVAAFLADESLPFARILSAERVERVFAKHDGLFGKQAIYSTAMMVWSFLGQVLRDGKEASCQAAVARVVNYCEHQQIAPPTADTGDYCRARAKLSEAALHELSREVAAEMQGAAPEDWLWRGKHAKLIDGFTFTMPATPQNLAEFPHPRTQKKGVGLPIARVVAIISLATACVTDAAIGPYKGKQTGETALLRSMLASLLAGDIAVFDRYYCSFMMIALLQLQGVDTCAACIKSATPIFAAAHAWERTIISSCGPSPHGRTGWTRRLMTAFPKPSNCVSCVTRSWNRAAARRRLRWSPR